MRKGDKSIRLVVVVSDIHAGSLTGLLPPGFVTTLEQPVPQNAVQRWLWECWSEATGPWLAKLAGSDPFALVVNGDIIEGCHHHTKEIISSETKDHYAAAVDVLEPLAKRAAKTYVVEGTETHTGNYEHSLAKQLKCEADPNTGRAAWEKLYLDVNGCRVCFQHHISATVREYLRGSMLSIFLGNEQLAAANNGEPIPKVLVCSHRHAYDKYDSGDSICIVTPPWQIKTRYGQKVVPASRTKPGIVALDWRGVEAGGLPEIHARTFRAPAMRGAEL